MGSALPTARTQAMHGRRQVAMTNGKSCFLQQQTSPRGFPPYVPRWARSASFHSSRFCYPWGPRLGPARTSRLRSMTMAVQECMLPACGRREPHLISWGPRPRARHAARPRSDARRRAIEARVPSWQSRNSIPSAGAGAGDGLLLLSTTLIGRTASDSRATRSGRYRRQSDDGAGWARASPSGARQYM